MKPDLKPAQSKFEMRQYLDATVYQETDGGGLPILITPLTARFFYCAITLPQRNNYGKMNLAIWEKMKWQDWKGKSGPPSNMNAFKHGLAAIQKRHEESVTTRARRQTSSFWTA